MSGAPAGRESQAQRICGGTSRLKGEAQKEAGQMDECRMRDMQKHGGHPAYLMKP